MEILAPAGGMDTIQPAVRTGADAVYLGASKLSARASAKNFSREELKEAVEYCHARGVKVYLACNTLVRDEELPEAMALIEYACQIPVDALIMQDIGLISLFHTNVRPYAEGGRTAVEYGFQESSAVQRTESGGNTGDSRSLSD